MTDKCAFSNDHRCIKWMDYMLTRYELEETEELCHGNWIEIKRLRRWTDALTDLLRQNNISYPDEYEFWEYADDCDE